MEPSRRRLATKAASEPSSRVASREPSSINLLALLSRKPLTPQEMVDHAESLKFLADMADRCARRLTELARISGKT